MLAAFHKIWDSFREDKTNSDRHSYNAHHEYLSLIALPSEFKDQGRDPKSESNESEGYGSATFIE